MQIEDNEEPDADSREGSLTEGRDAAFERAREAARNKNPEAMVTALYASGFLGGLVRRIDQRYHRLCFQDAQDAVAEAVEALYVKVSHGERVFSLGGFLFKVANWRAVDMDRVAVGQRIAGEGELEAIADPTAQGTGVGVATQERRAEQREEALKIARTLLPQLGQKKVRQVMGYIFDALEAGEVEVSGQEIADALVLSPETVYTCRSRGFQRLKRHALDKGLVAADFQELVVEFSEERDEQHD